MTTLMRICMQSLLKMVNSLIGMCGLATILYAFWMIRIWNRQLNDSYHPAPWFMYTILGLGAILCAITCWGHIAAETANGCCLYCVSSQIDYFYAWLNPLYLVFVVMVLMLEGAVTMDVLLNPKWEEVHHNHDFPIKLCPFAVYNLVLAWLPFSNDRFWSYQDFPQDPSGNLHKLRDFIKENIDMCKWVGLSILSVQGLSMVLAVILLLLGPNQISYDNDDEYTPEGVPLLKNYYSNQSSFLFGSKIDAWNS
ncbi:hypothetical protein OSB04_021772 [Centaurea solstitialis]|uniref:Tetraspanin n=1 Tax=Centaurea solstitialis TaxID=347529 RepID=A0AA38WGK2_9ASTR|nr:hypothetical protein OSB04_021772 [Centaurea solstitialis]